MSFCLCSTISTTSFYSLSLHDALPILIKPFVSFCIYSMTMLQPEFCEKDKGRTNFGNGSRSQNHGRGIQTDFRKLQRKSDRKSTRLNSSHVAISYAVFCLKKRNKRITK